MMHNNIVKADWFSTDTHGVTPLTFAAMHFLGAFFAPRIAGMEKRARCGFVKKRVYQDQGYKLLPDSLVNEAILEENWDDILRFMATIILRVTPASQLFQRLNSNAQKHPLYKALSEFGQIIETMYILRNIDEVEIRQAAEKELAKMEHINKFSKAVFNENNHVMQQETREMQLIADNCRRLIQNNIVGYNYLLRSQQVIDTPEGKQREGLLRRLKRTSMAIWYHIHMDGEYDFSDEKVNTITPFHLSKILGLKIDVKKEEELQPLD
jgi:TnpA family transposase